MRLCGVVWALQLQRQPELAAAAYRRKHPKYKHAARLQCVTIASGVVSVFHGLLVRVSPVKCVC